MPTSRIAVSLNAESLARVTDAVHVPAYDRQRLRRSVVHIGVGGFHRAHLATYIDELCQRGDVNWSIVGAGVLTGDARMEATLRRQDYLYTVIARGNGDARVQVIGSIVDFVHAAHDPERLIEQIANPDTQIVSLTVTEGGYPVDDVTGEYRPDSPAAGPRSAFAVLAAGLERRRTRGGGPLTVLSCDNILGNGRVARAATVGEARTISQELADWIVEQIAFPNSMVDRITPTTTDADRTWLAEEHGLLDAWPVVTESFRQWVVEDDFAGDRPPLEGLDVIVTDDIEPYELMKLRLLNAGHSCLAYLAALLGIDTVDQALADPWIRSFLVQFLRSEALPVVPPVAGVDLDEYVETLVERFSNPDIGDQIARLCLDGSAKCSKFVMPTIATNLANSGPVRLGALALAGWCEYLRLGSDPASPIQLSPDPHLEQLVEFARASGDDPAAFLGVDEVFDDALRSGRFADAFVDALAAIRSAGVRSAIEASLA